MNLSAFDPTSPEFRSNPYPFYEFLRNSAPLFYAEPWNRWFVTEYEDCKTLLADNRLGNNSGPDSQGSMLFRDPPDHTRLRRLVNKAFTPRTVERLRGRTQSIAAQLLDDIQSRAAKGETIDLIESYAYPIPLTVIAEMLGVPPKDHERFQHWSEALVQTLDLLPDDPARAEEAANADTGFRVYFDELIAERRARPQEDMVSELIVAEEAGDRLSSEELFNMCRLLLIAGHETTVNLIGNCVLMLLNHPDQLQRLKADPTLIKTTIEETMRFESPIQAVGRTPLEEFSYKGVEFKYNQNVIFFAGAANRDPKQFKDPQTFDVGRQHNPHMGFSHGIHYCLGAPLARMESQV
ncbi:MAG: cytochrome P450, partial [Chloroflexota bacterium]